MLYFGRVGSSWGHRAFFGRSWGEKVITPKSLEDALMHSKLPLEKPFDSVMSNDDATSSSHAMPTHRTMFVKPSISIHHTHTTSGNKGKRYNSIHTCHYCGITGHIRPICFQLRSQKPWDKGHACT
jgi:hypothetical protein